jgi:hypothetical protein
VQHSSGLYPETAIGAGGGAILGAIGGNAALGAAAGEAAGLAGGLIYDKVKKDERSAYQQGYAGGQELALRRLSRGMPRASSNPNISSASRATPTRPPAANTEAATKRCASDSCPSSVLDLDHVGNATVEDQLPASVGTRTMSICIRSPTTNLVSISSRPASGMCAAVLRSKVLSGLAPARLPLNPVTHSFPRLGVRRHAVSYLPIDSRQGTA